MTKSELKLCRNTKTKNYKLESWLVQILAAVLCAALAPQAVLGRCRHEVLGAVEEARRDVSCRLVIICSVATTGDIALRAITLGHLQCILHFQVGITRELGNRDLVSFDGRRRRQWTFHRNRFIRAFLHSAGKRKRRRFDFFVGYSLAIAGCLDVTVQCSACAGFLRCVT